MGRTILFLTVTAALLTATALGFAIEPDKDEPKPKVDPPKDPPKSDSPKTSEKTVKFDMDKKPWREVFEWLTEKTDLPFISVNIPRGTFTFIAPKGKSFTIPEIIDIINQGLLTAEGTNKFVLIRTENRLTLVPADEKFNPDILKHVSANDGFAGLGDTEVVSVEIKLKNGNAEDLSKDLAPMLGAFGRADFVARPNLLILTDTVKNLKRIVKLVEESEKEGNIGDLKTWFHTCKYIKATDAEQILNKQLGDPLGENDRMNPRDRGGFGQGGFFPGGGFPGGGFPGGGFPGGGFPGGGNAGGGNAGGGTPGERERPRGAAQPARKIRMHYVSSDISTNKVIVTGPPDIIARAEEIMKTLDVKHGDEDPIIPGHPRIEKYAVPSGDAEAVAKALREAYPPSTSLRISASGTNAILVWATPEDQFRIAGEIEKATTKNSKGELIFLSPNLDAAAMAESLGKMYGDPKTGAPYFEADADRNAIFVRGSKEQVDEVKDMIKARTGPSGGGVVGDSSNMRVFKISGSGSGGAALADVLKELLPQMGNKNPVKINIPGGDDKKPEPPKEKEKEKDGKDKSSGRWDDRSSLRNRTAARDNFLADPQEQPKPGDKPGDKKDVKGAPINITVIGDRLYVTSDDPEALAMVSQIIRLMTSPEGKGDWQVIKLKNVSAVDTAKIIDEAFNGPKQQTNQPVNPFNPFGRFGQPPAPATPAKEPTVRVVADPATNSLLVKASPLDMIQIRKMIGDHLDSGQTESKAIARTFVLGPYKFASVTDLSNTIKDVYREQMNQNPSTSSGGRLPGFAFIAPNRNVDAAGNPRNVNLSVGVDEQTNTLVVNCSEALKNDIEKMCNSLEEKAKDNKRTVTIMSLPGADATQVQKALDAIQGRTSGTGTSPFGMGGFGPGGGFRGPGGGGFGGGGFGGGGFGGGGMRGPGGGGGFRPGQRSDRGPDFFADRVMDDPEPSLLFDPQQSASDGREAVNNDAEEQQAPPPPKTESIEGPRLPVQVEALPELGGIIIRASNAEDAKAVEKIILQILEYAKRAETEIRLYRLKHGDALSIVTTLNQLFQRVQIGPSGTTTTAGGTTSSTQLPFGTLTQSTQTPVSVVMIPIARFNAILLACPTSRMADVIKEIDKLDQPIPPQGGLRPFGLKKASASRVATMINNFWNTRYSPETALQHLIKLTYDDDTNTVYVQAAPADMEEIASLIEHLDVDLSPALNEMRIIHLNNALADDLTTILQQAIYSTIVPPTGGVGGAGAIGGGALGVGGGALGAGGGAFGAGGGAFGAGGGAPGGAFGAGGGAFGAPGGALGAAGGALGGAGGALGAAGAAGGALGAAGGVRAGQPGAATKTTTIKFLTQTKAGQQFLESGSLQDIHITPDIRTNSLIVAANEKSMQMLLVLIKDLDVPPAALAEIKVFPLERSDANTTATILQQIFLGSSATGARAGGLPGAPGVPGGVTGGATTGVKPLQISVGGAPVEGAPLVDLRISVDERTNSIIVAGSRNDLLVIEAMLYTLENSKVQARHNEVYHLKNAAAADVANALQTFLNNAATVYTTSVGGTVYFPYQLYVEQQVVIIPEPVSNKLLISATERYFQDVMRLIMELDAQPPQVVIQVLMAEVDLNNTEEFGMELGLQSPVLFTRSIIPANGTGGTQSITTPATGVSLLQNGFSVAGTTNVSAFPGFAFNTTNPLGANASAGGPAIVGFQGISNLGVGRASSTNNIGGFVFSAASDTFSLLIRALKTQGRIDILSRPQLTTLDNQQATILVGQQVPYISSTNVTSTGLVTNGITYKNVGVQLAVTPRISPDGHVLMRVTPEISTVAQSTVSLGNGVTASAFNVQTLDTTVAAMDGETIVIGGMITKRDERTENKIPWLGDLPGVGALWRFRTQNKAKVELLVILTPHIVRTTFDADRILAEESRRMDWVIGDVLKTQGTSGMEPILPPPPALGPNGCLPAALPLAPSAPALSAPALSAPVSKTTPKPDFTPIAPANYTPALPATNPAAPAASGPSLNTVTAQPELQPLPPSSTDANLASPAPDQVPVQGKESARWNPFKRLK
jgi:type II secretion system protein D